MVCPHAVIRAKVLRRIGARRMRRTGSSRRRSQAAASPTCDSRCRLASKIAPAASSASKPARRTASRQRAHARSTWTAKAPLVERERRKLGSSRRCRTTSRRAWTPTLVRGVQYLTPLFEFSGACAGCGETPYLKLLTQLFGDRLLVANATGCSSIYGGNLPTTPWSVNAEGRGPAWANSLFEDNAEFGLGFRLSLDKHREQAEELLRALAPELGAVRVREILEARAGDPGRRGCAARARRRPRARTGRPRRSARPATAHPRRHLVRRASGSSAATAGRMTLATADSITCSHPGATSTSWCWTPRCTRTPAGRRPSPLRARAVAKFAAGGKQSRKKDLGLMAITYGNVYVAQIAMGA